MLNVGELGRYLAWTVVTFSVLIILVWALVRSGLLPEDAYLSNPDSAIISTKALLASQSPKKSIAFVGDSSCLINIDIPTLKDHGIDAVNLGTLSYLSIDSFGRLAQRFCEGKPSPEIILVVHPECLRLTETSAEHRAQWQSIPKGNFRWPPEPVLGPLDSDALAGAYGQPVWIHRRLEVSALGNGRYHARNRDLRPGLAPRLG